jgi:DMSO/TMAO reductase YedYZ heme-binding membrane subunit
LRARSWLRRVWAENRTWHDDGLLGRGKNVAWYVDRTGGILGFALLTASAVLGVTLAGRPRLVRWPRFAIEDVHRFAGMLAGVFIWLHVLVFLLDNYLSFGLTDLLVPGAAPYRPVWTALGVVAAELLLAIAITNRFRTRLPYAFWRRAHMLNFLVWSLALVHGITAGSDTDTGWAQLLYACCGRGRRRGDLAVSAELLDRRQRSGCRSRPPHRDLGAADLGPGAVAAEQRDARPPPARPSPPAAVLRRRLSVGLDAPPGRRRHGRLSGSSA